MCRDCIDRVSPVLVWDMDYEAEAVGEMEYRMCHFDGQAHGTPLSFRASGESEWQPVSPRSSDQWTGMLHRVAEQLAAKQADDLFEREWSDVARKFRAEDYGHNVYLLSRRI